MRILRIKGRQNPFYQVEQKYLSDCPWLSDTEKKDIAQKLVLLKMWFYLNMIPIPELAMEKYRDSLLEELKQERDGNQKESGEKERPYSIKTLQAERKSE